ncbi:unnamed protein product, partial [Hymenolepis diminuta]
SSITLEDLANECRKLGIRCDGSLSLQKSGEHNCINRISNEMASQNVFTSLKPLTEC